MHESFLMGAIAMGFAMASLIFLRFWKESGDRIFAWFALAFLMLAANRVLLDFFNEMTETRAEFYLLRLLAFLVILGAVVDKNIRRHP